MGVTYKQPGDAYTFIAAATITKDVPTEVGQLLVIPTKSVVSGEKYAAHLRGVFSGFTKIGSQGWTVGQVIYWDDGNSRFTTVSTANLRCGVALEAVASGAGDTTTGDVYLDGGMRPDG